MWWGLFGAALPISAFGSTSTTLAWLPSADPNVAGYNIYYGTNSHDYHQLLGLGNVTQAMIENLELNTTYFFSLKSRDAAGNEGGFSAEMAYARYNATPDGSVLRIKTMPPTLTNELLAFSLAPGAPTGASINPTNGLLSWCPELANANSTNEINVIITDLANPAADTHETVVIAVSDFLKITLATVPVQCGQTASLPLHALASENVAYLTINLNWPGASLLNPTLTFNAPFSAGTLQNLGNHLLIQLWCTNGAALASLNSIGQINFQAAAGQTSAFVDLPVTSALANRADGSTFSNIATAAGEVAIIGENPLLRALTNPDQSRTLTLYANPGITYQLQSSTNLAPPVVWQPLQEVAPTNILQSVDLDSKNPVVFYRLMQE